MADAYSSSVECLGKQNKGELYVLYYLRTATLTGQ